VTGPDPGNQPFVQIARMGAGNWIQGGRAPARGGRHQTLPLPGGTPASRAGGGLVTHMRLRLGFGRLVADRAKREGPSSFGCTVYGVSLELGPGSVVRVPLEPPFLVREQPLGRARGDSLGFTTRRLGRAPRSRSRSGRSGVGHLIIGLTAAKGPCLFSYAFSCGIAAGAGWGRGTPTPSLTPRRRDSGRGCVPPRHPAAGHTS